MLESNFLSSAFETEIFPDWSLSSQFEEPSYLCSWGSDPFPLPVFHGTSDFDEFNIEEFESSSPLSDAFVSQILGESYPITDNVNEDHFYNKPFSYSNSLSSSKSTIYKKKNSFECAQTPKSWSNMTVEEQAKSLTSISEATCQMGIREKLEIIKIMDPFIEISADMKEFTLDTSLLNDSKYRKIQEIFKKQSISFPPQNSSSNSSVESRKTSRNSKISKKSNSFSRTCRKQREKKQRISPESDELRKVKRKQARQCRKEEKSGLFVYEKVVKFSSLDEDEDVNILE